MQYIIMCICGYVCMCTMCKCSTCSFSICSLVIALSVCLSQSSMLHCILHLLKFVACVMCVVYACCGCLSLQLIAHLSAYQTVSFALDYRVPEEPLSFQRGETSCTLKLGHPHSQIYTDLIQMLHLSPISKVLGSIGEVKGNPFQWCHHTNTWVTLLMEYLAW